jgi:VRR-NUC domain
MKWTLRESTHGPSCEVLDELVLDYPLHDLADWIAGRRSRWLSGPVPTQVSSQPAYHFGEYFVLEHYRQLGWRGHRFYALGSWEPHNSKLAEGRKALASCFSQSALTQFRAVRESCGRADGKGEPDLFLAREDGAALFLEVKKQHDRVSPEQLQCLAQIRAILKAGVGIVYLRLAGSPYRPKRYELDLSAMSGQQVAR